MSRQVKIIIILSILIFGGVVVWIIIAANAKKKKAEEDAADAAEQIEILHNNSEATNCTAMGADCVPYTDDMKSQDTKAIQDGCAPWFIIPFMTFMYWDCTRKAKNRLPIVGFTCVHLNKKHEVKGTGSHKSIKYDLFEECSQPVAPTPFHGTGTHHFPWENQNP